jgi:hypothetical protein
MNGRIEPFLLDGDSIGIFVKGRKTLDQMLWEEAWPSLVKLLLAAVVSLIFLALPLLAAYDSAVENGAREPEGLRPWMQTM